jgi:hypothetical protein
MDFGIAETGIARGSPPGTTTEVLRFGVPFAEIRVVSSGIRAETHFLRKETPIRLVNCENRLIGTVRLHRLVSCSIEV